MRRGFTLVCAGLLFPAMAAAQDLVASPRPQARPAHLSVEQTVLVPDILTQDAAAPDTAAPSQGVAQATGITTSPRPLRHPVPWPLVQVSQDQAEPAPSAQAPTKKSKKGSVCGDPAIKGEKLARVKSKVKGCGVDAPVRVTSVDGIKLSQPATIDCETAVALKDWVRTGLRPAMGQREVVELTVAAHYICRPRNNVKGNKVSEHGRGKAIDISGIVFADGTSWSVAHDYNRQIRKAYKAACGIFGTTLGPGSDGYHEDHMHFDTASHRSGPYCR